MVRMPSHHQPRGADWLIPAALAFLAVAVLFAVAIVIVNGGSSGRAESMGAPSRGASAAGSGAPVASTPGAPATTPPAAPKTSAPPPAAPVRTSTGLCLDLSPADAGDGAQALQAACDGSAHQNWRVTALGGDVVALTNAASGKCLDVNGGSTEESAKVQTWSCTGGANQQWHRQDAGGGRFFLVAVHSNKCLDVAGGANPAPGILVQQFTCNGTDAQRWQFG